MISPISFKDGKLQKLFSNISDSGISTDESPTAEKVRSTNIEDNMMFRVSEVIEKGKFKVVTPRSFSTPKKKYVPFHLPEYLRS